MTALLLAAESASTASGGWFLRNAWLVPLIPAASFVAILFVGKRTTGKGAPIGIAAVAASFVMAVGAAVQWIQRVNAAEGGHGVEPVTRSVAWFEAAGAQVRAGILIDGLAVTMMVVVTLISLLVHVYSTDYLHGDRRYTHFFAFLSLFTASMLSLVVADNLLMLLVSWELVGVCSFVLIGHWWEEKANSDAALKAFITNRVGDMGLLIGVTILFFAAGQTFDILTINEMAVGGEIRDLLLLVTSVSLLAAVMSKSGQFFLHTWLPDAMAGPTPVSALIHAATMVVAGVFMIGRLYGVFFEGLSIAGSSINLMALMGGVTALVGASLAFVQRDIKKVLAYSTVSQLGYMVMAMGVGAWTAAIFHLFTHAFFKALLFLGAGSVSHAVHSFDMKSDMGGLRRVMPKTFVTFAIGSAALAGIPPLAGFWSKDEILAGTGSFPGTGGNGDYHLMLVMGLVVAGLTAAYMTRVLYLVFFGEYRGHGHPHESGPRITVPLQILAVLSVVAGFANLPSGLAGLPDGWTLRFEHYVEPVGAYFPDVAHASASALLAVVATAIALAGAAAAYSYYFGAVARRSRAERRALTELPDGPTTRYAPARGLHALLANKYYLDKLYSDVIAAGVKGPIARTAYWFDQRGLDAVVNQTGRRSVDAGRYVYKYVDQLTIDGVVNGTGALSETGGEELRRLQTGRVQHYAALLFSAAAILAGVFILILT